MIYECGDLVTSSDVPLVFRVLRIRSVAGGRQLLTLVPLGASAAPREVTSRLDTSVIPVLARQCSEVPVRTQGARSTMIQLLEDQHQ